MGSCHTSGCKPKGARRARSRYGRPTRIDNELCAVLLNARRWNTKAEMLEICAWLGKHKMRLERVSISIGGDDSDVGYDTEP